MTRILAAADIGSNTAHLLVASVDDQGNIRRLANVSEWLSLGEAVVREGIIPEDLVSALSVLLRDFKGLSNQRRAESMYVFATEAMRSAKNGEEAIASIERSAGVLIDLIPPRKEAEFSWTGASIDAPLPIGAFVEIGGGSAQVVLPCEDGQADRYFSLPLGTGRLIGSVELEQPIKADSMDLLHRTIGESIISLPEQLDHAGPLVASGGVSRGLWRALHRDGDKWLHRTEIEYLLWSCQRLTLGQIVARFGVKPKRAAALYPGGAVLLAIMDRFAFDSVFVSEFGVREGAVLRMAGEGSAWLA